MFDAKAKTLLLEADQNFQMHTAMQEAMQEASSRGRGLTLGLPRGPIQQYLVLEVRRHHLVNDTINQLTKCASADLKKPLKVITVSLIISLFHHHFTGYVPLMTTNYLPPKKPNLTYYNLT